MRPHQLCPQTGIWIVPDTCKEPAQEGAPYHCRPSLSLSFGAMPTLFPVLPPPGCPPSGFYPGQVFCSPSWMLPTLAAWHPPASSLFAWWKLEGVAAFLSTRAARLLPPWTSSGLPLGPLLGWSRRGQGRGAWLRCGAADGLAQLGWTRPEKDAGHGPVGCTPFLISHHPLPLLIPFSAAMAFNSFSC